MPLRACKAGKCGRSNREKRARGDSFGNGKRCRDVASYILDGDVQKETAKITIICVEYTLMYWKAVEEKERRNQNRNQTTFLVNYMCEIIHCPDGDISIASRAVARRLVGNIT